MSGGGLVWAKTPDDERGERDETVGHGEVDESFAARRLRRWIKGMFGGEPAPQDKPPEGEREDNA